MKLQKKVCCFLAYVLLLISSTAVAQSTSFQELVRTDSSQHNNKNNLHPNHWVYKNLKQLSGDYGLLINTSDNKFSGEKPLTRNEAAILLINLVGKIEENKTKISEAEKARIEILQDELHTELNLLSGRVEAVEDSVKTLKGSVAKLEKSDKSSVKFGYGETMQITGAIQALYNGNLQEGLDSRPSNFRLPVIDFTLQGKIRPHLDYCIRTFPNRRFDSPIESILSDVYFLTDIIPNSKLFMGQTRKPIGLEGSQSPYTLETIERAQVARKFSDVRDIGFKLIGNWRFLDYMAGIYNGSGENQLDTNRDLDYSLVTMVNPFYKNSKLGKLKLGGTFSYGNNNFTSKTYGVIAKYLVKNFLIQSEYMKKDGFNLARNNADGWYIHSSCFLTDKFQLVGRFDTFDGNTGINSSKISEYTLGSNYYFDKHRMKLMLNLVFVDNKNGTDSRRVLLMNQYRF